MTKNKVQELESLRNTGVSASDLKQQLGNVLENSGDCRAIVESLNRETGEYRIVLQGTFGTTEK